MSYYLVLAALDVANAVQIVVLQWLFIRGSPNFSLIVNALFLTVIWQPYEKTAVTTELFDSN